MSQRIYYFALLTFLLCCSTVNAQIIIQPARVREISYTQTGKITPVAGVRVKVETEERSNEQGDVVLRVSKTADNTYMFKEVSKVGYTLISPSSEELNTKKFPLNSAAAIDIVVAKTETLMAERRRIEANLHQSYKSKVEGLERQIDSLNQLLSKSSAVDSETEKLKVDRDNLKEQIRTLYQGFSKIESQFSEDADKLSRIDYIGLDSITLRNVELRKAGLADEIIEYNKYLLPDNVEEITKTISHSIESMKRDLERHENPNLFKADRYKDMADGYAMKFMCDSALYCLQIRAELVPEQIDAQIDYVEFLQLYFGQYTQALQLYEDIYSKCTKLYGDNSIELIPILSNMGALCIHNNNLDLALQNYQQALSIAQDGDESTSLYVAHCYIYIGLAYCSNKDYKEALVNMEKGKVIIESSSL